MEINHLTRGVLLPVLMLVVLVGGEVQVVEKLKGGSAVLPCVHRGAGSRPMSLALKRRRPQESRVMFMSAGDEAVEGGGYEERVGVSGDPGTGVVNVTLRDLRGSDTGSYYCEFTVKSDGRRDQKLPGQTEYFLYVDDVDVSGSLDVGLLETCAGGSAVVPCHGASRGDAPEPGGGVCLKRWRGRGPAEVLFHSKRRNDTGTGSSSSSSSSLGLRLDTAPGGLAYYNLLRLQREDSAFYSCELLVADGPDCGATLGRRMYFVSVKDGQCQCSSYATVLYATSGAVALLLILFVALACHVRRSKGRDRVKRQAPCPIYEEMVGVQQQPLRKKTTCRPDETDTSLYSTAPEKARHENPYDVPGAQQSR